MTAQEIVIMMEKKYKEWDAKKELTDNEEMKIIFEGKCQATAFYLSFVYDKMGHFENAEYWRDQI